MFPKVTGRNWPRHTIEELVDHEVLALVKSGQITPQPPVINNDSIVIPLPYQNTQSNVRFTPFVYARLNDDFPRGNVNNAIVFPYGGQSLSSLYGKSVHIKSYDTQWREASAKLFHMMSYEWIVEWYAGNYAWSRYFDVILNGTTAYAAQYPYSYPIGELFSSSYNNTIRMVENNTPWKTYKSRAKTVWRVDTTNDKIIVYDNGPTIYFKLKTGNSDTGSGYLSVYTTTQATADEFNTQNTPYGSIAMLKISSMVLSDEFLTLAYGIDTVEHIDLNYPQLPDAQGG